LLASLCLSTGKLFADQAQRRIEEETRQRLQATEAPVYTPSPEPVIDYGGWQNIRYIEFHDDDKDSSTADSVDYMTWFDTRLWLKATLKPALKAEDALQREYALYLRLKNWYTISAPKETAGGSDNDGPHLEYAYLSFQMQPAWLRVGRHYFSVGQGLAYGDVDDGVSLLFNFPKLRLKTFWSHTPKHEDNIDSSVPGYDKTSDRHFFGAECSYLGLSGNDLYTYVLIQRDFSDERPEDSAHNYDYQSEYFALGWRGKFKDTLSYWWESIRETGKSYVYNTDAKHKVSAWAHIFAISYAPKVYTQPSFYFKYAYGSGDPDRTSVTDTIGGNTSGKDKNFLYFGFIPTGYALAAQLSNLYFLKTGLTFRPLESNPFFKHLVTSLDYYRYYKDVSTGGIYDPKASQDSADVGSEIDLTLNWQILSDLAFSLEYGHFMPGKAYPVSSNDSEDYLSLSTSISF
jgi:hypothetical protein